MLLHIFHFAAGSPTTEDRELDTTDGAQDKELLQNGGVKERRRIPDQQEVGAHIALKQYLVSYIFSRRFGASVCDILIIPRGRGYSYGVMVSVR